LYGKNLGGIFGTFSQKPYQIEEIFLSREEICPPIPASGYVLALA